MFLTLILSSLLTFVELNCENLFDTRHDSLKNDVEFLPEGSYHWTPYRYWHKVNHLGQEIVAQSNSIPDFVAMCEVENDSVMFDLTKRSLLRNAGYEYVMTSSPDERGIDVALLYQPASFALLHSHSIRIKPLPDTRPTRDILYASGLIITGDTLHVFVVHAPSRRGGEQVSRPYRLQVASQLAEAVDSVYAISRDAKIIIAGDSMIMPTRQPCSISMSTTLLIYQQMHRVAMEPRLRIVGMENGAVWIRYYAVHPWQRESRAV